MADSVYDIPFWADEDQQAKAQAMARALRGQQLAGTLLAAMGGGQKAAPMIGQQIAQQAGQEYGLGAKFLEQLPQYRMEQQKLAQNKAQMAAQQHPAYAAGVQSLLGRYEPEVAKAAQGAPPQVLEKLLGPAERGYAAREAAKSRMAVAGAQWGQGPMGGEGSPVAALSDAIMRGEQPPEIKGLYRWGGPVRAELARRGFDLSKANLDWQATQKNLATLNGPQQVRIRQAAMTANESLSNIENLYNEWKQLGGASGFKLLNKASLAMSKSAPGRLGAVAQALEMNIADLTSELGVVYMGGNTPTDHALSLASKNLSADWNEQQFTEAVKQARQNLGYRLNSIKHSAPTGIGGPSRYAPEAPPEAAPQPTAAPAAPAQRVRKFKRGPDGKLVEVNE